MPHTATFQGSGDISTPLPPMYDACHDPDQNVLHGLPACADRGRFETVIGKGTFLPFLFIFRFKKFQPELLPNRMSPPRPKRICCIQGFKLYQDPSRRYWRS